MAEGPALDTVEKENKFENTTGLPDFASDEVDNNIPVTIHPSNLSEGCSLEERFSSLTIFKKPLCLISTDEHGKLQIQDSVLSQIKQIDVPLNIVGVCGLYRTGKSYLMNRLAGETKGFSLGSSTTLHTKGIWAWCKVHPMQDGQVLVLLDTEGLADIKKGNADHDNILFSLTLLLCSTLIYNMTGVFNQEALEKLTFITKVSEHVQVMGTNSTNLEDDSLIRFISPIFVLCLRDFYFDIETGGKEVTADEYFSDCLKPEKGPNSDTYNKTRECITSYFQQRKCFTLSLPVAGKKLKKLEGLDNTQLDEDFVREIDEMRDFVYDQKFKCLDGVTQTTVDGKVFATIASMYVEQFRKGSPIKYRDTFELIAEQVNTKIMEKILDEFDKEMDTIPLPQDQKLNLQTLYNENKNRALCKFRGSANPFQKLDFENKASTCMEKKYDVIQLKNRHMLRDICQKTLSNLYSVKVEQHSAEYATEKGHNVYMQNMRALEKEFHSKMENVDKDERLAVWLDLKYNTKDENMRLYAAATDMADKDRDDKENEEKIRERAKLLKEMTLQENQVDFMRKMKKRKGSLYKDPELNKETAEEAMKTAKQCQCQCIVI